MKDASTRQNSSGREKRIAYGREAFINELWSTLEGYPPETNGRSIYINDLRRIGKTRILEHMEDDPRPGFRVMKRDVEGINSADVFAQEVYRDTLIFLNKWRRFGGWAVRTRDACGGFGIWQLKIPEYRYLPCERLLRKTFGHLNECLAKKDERLVCIWDELPALLENIIDRHGSCLKEGVLEASRLLDTLRAVRQECSQICMIFTGSIGMHHILNKLRRNGYQGRPLNDMKPMAPGPLVPEEGKALAARFLSKRKKLPEDMLDTCAETVSTGVGHIPYYIEGLVNTLPSDMSPSSITPEKIQKILADRLANSDWDLRYFEERIPNLYGRENVFLVNKILDYLAETRNPVTEKEIVDWINRVAKKGVEASMVHELMDLLVNDHYAVKMGDPVTYSFRSSLIRRWWCMNHGLKCPLP